MKDPTGALSVASDAPPAAAFPAIEYDLKIHDGEVMTVFRLRDSGIRLAGDGIEWRIDGRPQRAALADINIIRLTTEVETRRGPIGAISCQIRALSRQHERARIESLQVGTRHSAATAACHSAAASVRKIRSVDREMRWRWRLKVLWTAAWTLRKRCADAADLKRCILRSRRRTT